jgi:hypothetical protein
MIFGQLRLEPFNMRVLVELNLLVSIGNSGLSFVQWFYVLDREEILFRTANGSKLAAAVRHAVVGFQVDEFDPEFGWAGRFLAWARPMKCSIPVGSPS